MKLAEESAEHREQAICRGLRSGDRARIAQHIISGVFFGAFRTTCRKSFRMCHAKYAKTDLSEQSSQYCTSFLLHFCSGRSLALKDTWRTSNSNCLKLLKNWAVVSTKEMAERESLLRARLMDAFNRLADAKELHRDVLPQALGLVGWAVTKAGTSLLGAERP